MGAPEQTSNDGSNKPTFSPITQAVPEIWPKTWTEYSCCYHNVRKIHKHTSLNRDTPDFIDVPDQSSHGRSNKQTFSQIAQALPEI